MANLDLPVEGEGVGLGKGSTLSVSENISSDQQYTQRSLARQGICRRYRAEAQALRVGGSAWAALSLALHFEGGARA